MTAKKTTTKEELALQVSLEERLLWLRGRGACSPGNGDSFFPEKGGSTRAAKAVCRGCKVRTECLEYAVAAEERYGVWGGLSERERRRLKREAA